MMTLPLVDGDRRPDTTTVRDLDWCDYFLVSFSGGKDSIALALSLRKKGVPAQRIILMHQHVDGEPGEGPAVHGLALHGELLPGLRQATWACASSSSGGTAASTGRC